MKLSITSLSLAFTISILGFMRAGAATLTIENETLSVRYDDVAHSFTLTENSTSKKILTDGHLLATGDIANPVPVQDPVFGAGNSIQVKQTDGTVSSLQLFPGLPFLLVKGELHNLTNADVEISHSVPASFDLNLDKPASGLKTVGTAGLTATDKNPGSYLFLTCADPATRHGVVAGWITEDRGSGVLFSSVTNDQVNFKAQIDYGHLRIPAGQSANLETLAIGVFDDARIGEELYADAIKKQYDIKLRPQKAVYCSWYAEKHGKAGYETSTVELAKFAAKELNPFGFGVVQVDDEWQDGPHYNGPRRGFDRVRPDGPYAHGIAPVAAEVEKQGLTFGLWFLPFARNFQDPEYKDRQDWFVKRLDGTPYDTAWGGTCLDLTNPDVKAQLAMLAKTYRSWGVRYFKMDGLWTGAACEQIYVNEGYKDDHFGNNMPFHDPLVTNIEAYRSGLKLLRESAGNDVFFSGCCIAQNMRELTAIGLVDSMRIGPDYNADGNLTKTDPIRGSGLYFLNGRVWWNDPDVSIVRATGESMGCTPVSLSQARLGASWVSIAGQFAMNSDWIPDLPADRLEVLKRTMLYHGATARPVDYFDNCLPNTWLLTDTRQPVRRDVIGVFNQDDSDLHVDYSLAQIGLARAETYHAFNYWDDVPAPDVSGRFKSTISPHSCQIIAVRASEGRPVLVSTSRHVSQGIVDVKEETWRDNTLSGTSEIIGNDPYELRVAGLHDGAAWKLTTADVSPEDVAAGVKVEILPLKPGELGWARLRISGNHDTRGVKWSLGFENK